MEKVMEQYSLWCKQALPEELAQDLEAISNDKNEIFDRFCKEQTFGTSGLRAKMGAGTNRINQVVILRATEGVADYLVDKHKHKNPKHPKRPKMVIGYDTRINSREYALLTAQCLSGRGIDALLFDGPTPVPVVSFTIGHLKADGGIMITASHNPKEFNGYKVYDHNGNQIDDQKARKVEEYIAAQPYFKEQEEALWENPLPVEELVVSAEASEGQEAEAEADETLGEIKILDSKVKEAYLRAVAKCMLPWTDKKKKVKEALADLNVVYTPLNGAGRDYAVRVFERLGVDKLTKAQEQWEYDGTFETCPAPNPENEKTFNKALEYVDENTDIIVATDPDSDRLGVMALRDGKFTRLTGDQVGILMLDYVLSCHKKGLGDRKLTPTRMVYKSFVSSPLAENIADYYGVGLKNVPTGFKNIAAEMETLKKEGREKDFIFGFEESLGYLYGNYTRDKDGILALQMVCLMTACLKAQGSNLFDKLEELKEAHGYMESKAISIEFASEKDREKMDLLMAGLFDGELTELMGKPLEVDNSHSCRNMFKARVAPGHQVVVRPSGTELKIKIYAFAKGVTRGEAEGNLESLLAELQSFAVKYN